MTGFLPCLKIAVSDGACKILVWVSDPLCACVGLGVCVFGIGVFMG